MDKSYGELPADTKSEEPKKRKLKSKPSFEFKESRAKLSESGLLSRPIHRINSLERDQGMTDKLFSLMESYLPKDIHSIQKR